MEKEENVGRPKIETIVSSAELRQWYWLKDELVQQAKNCGVKTTGAKFTILDRLCHFLDTGEANWPGDKRASVKSKFDWHKEPLFPDTVLTDSYKNTQNVRRFFQNKIGADFKFNIAFMEWIKSNQGKTLQDAVEYFVEYKKHSNTIGYQTNIKAHNQFNQYTRDFLAANPELGMDDVRRFWKLKTQLPSPTGRHIYERSDLDLKES